MSFRRSPRFRSAFTLIELIVVVIVLGLLLAVALPSFFGASTAAQDSAAKQYLSTSYKELKAAIAQNDGQPPAQASLVSAMASGEPQLTFLSSAASSASSGPLKTVYVENTGSGYKLGVHSASGALITLTADRSTGYTPVFSGGAGGAVVVVVSAPVNSGGLPTISGTVQVGQTLSASPGTWSNSPSLYSYVWLRLGSPISGQTGATYLLVSADASTTISVQVTASNDGGSSAPATSSATGSVQAAPANTALPTLSGTTQVWQTLSAAAGTWTGTPSPTLSYQWQRCNSGGSSCANLSGATGTTYTLALADNGLTVRAAVTGTNTVGTSSPAYSAASAVIAATAPVFVAATHTGIANDTSLTLSVPAGTAAGDTMIAMLLEGNSTYTFGAAPSGWTEIDGSSNGVAIPGNFRLGLYKRTATGSDTNPTWTTSTLFSIEGAITTIRGANTVSAATVIAGTNAAAYGPTGAAGTSFSMSSISAGSSCLLWTGFGFDNGTFTAGTNVVAPTASGSPVERVDYAEFAATAIGIYTEAFPSSASGLTRGASPASDSLGGGTWLTLCM